jgi:putative transposon protein; possible DNA segregation ATPase
LFKDIWSFKGLRVRKFYKDIRAMQIVLFFLPFASLLAWSAYSLQSEFMRQPIFYGGLYGGGMVFSLLLSVYIVLKLEAHVLFFSRLRSLAIMQRFLYENGFIYPVKSRWQEKKDTYRLPKVYIKQSKYGMDIYFELRGGKFQERFLKLGGELENTFDGDFMSRNHIKGYTFYRIAIDRFSSRLNVHQVVVDSKGLRLMKDVWWNFDSEPHLLLAGGTGGGKTVLIMEIALALAKIGYIDLCDPKESDLTVLKKAKVFKNRVFASKEEMIQCLRDNVALMVERYRFMTSHPDNKIGKSYKDYGLKPKFIIFDEWAAFIALLDSDYKMASEAVQLLTQIILKGRQAGFFMILGLQRADGEFIKTALRDNFMKRLSVGVLEDTGYTMLYGDANRNKNFKNIDEVNGEKVKGRGYIANGGQTAGEFFSPYVPFDKGFDFLEEFEKLPVLPNDEVSLPTEQTQEELLSEAKHLPVDPIFEEQERTIWYVDNLAKQLNKSFKQVKDVIDRIEQGAYYQFKREENKVVLKEFEKDVIVAIFEEKEKTGERYQEVIQKIFEQGKEVA